MPQRRKDPKSHIQVSPRRPMRYQCWCLLPVADIASLSPDSTEGFKAMYPGFTVHTFLCLHIPVCVTLSVNPCLIKLYILCFLWDVTLRGILLKVFYSGVSYCPISYLLTSSVNTLANMLLGVEVNLIRELTRLAKR